MFWNYDNDGDNDDWLDFDNLRNFFDGNMERKYGRER